MNASTPRRKSPLTQLVLARLREFYREPEAVFWVYGFPVLMIVALGIAFRNKPIERVTVDVEIGPAQPAAGNTAQPAAGNTAQPAAGNTAQAAFDALAKQEKFVVAMHDADICRTRLRTGKTDLVVTARPDSTPHYDYAYDPTRAESVLARETVDDALQRAAGRHDAATVADRVFDEPGGRYIDFLVPGLLGMSLMGGGMWGVGFAIVDLRLRKLLKRYLATPMKKTDFLAGMIISRLVFMVPEVLVLIGFARLAFGVVIYGSLATVVALVLLGAGAFAGIGLLIASRAKTIESVSGLMNLVMLPMWMLSGVFFSSDRFPDVVRPAIKALPLTLLNDALRAVMQEGASFSSQWLEVAGLTAWGVVTFALALRWFRWS